MGTDTCEHMKCKMFYSKNNHTKAFRYGPLKRSTMRRSKLVICLVVLGLISLVSWVVDGQTDEQQQAGVSKCAARASCKQRSRRLELDAGSDKRACYCDSNCVRYDDCCADSPRAANLSARVELGRQHISSIRSQWLCRKLGIFGDVLLKSSCAPDWPRASDNRTETRDEDVEVRRRCEGSGELLRSQQSQTDPLGWLLPITDLSSGLTYANQHCLRCNRPLLEAAKLVYWSPLLECNYKPDIDDRNALYDLLLSDHGRALEYSSKLARWTLRVSKETPTSGERVCSVAPSVPDSVEHMIRFCRLNTIDSCPPSTNLNASNHQDRLECELGHQALVYSQTSEAIYRNLACARCNRERQVFCEPRTRKQLQPGVVNRVVVHHKQSQQQPAGERILFAPAGPIADEPELPSDVSRTVLSNGASFSVLLDLYGSSGADEQIGAMHRCQERQGQVYDPFFLTCRDVVCGLNQRYDAQLARCVTSIGQDQGEPLRAHTNVPSDTQIGHANATEPVPAARDEAPAKSVQVEGWQSDQDAARRKFAECGKILVPAEHYRLFTSVLSQPNTANQSIEGRPLEPAAPSNLLNGSNKLWAYVEPYQLTLESSQFELVRSLRPQQVRGSALVGQSASSESGQPAVIGSSPELASEFALLICTPFASDLVAKFKPAMAYVTSVLLCVSVASLALYLLLYTLSLLDLRSISLELARAEYRQESARTKSLNPLARPRGSKDSAGMASLAGVNSGASTRASQSLSSRGVACLAASLFSAYLLFLLGAHRKQTNQKEQSDGDAACKWLAIATYYCFLVAFSWMFLLAYDIWRTLRLATRQLRGPALHSQSRRFISYALGALLSSALIVALAILADTQPACSSAGDQDPLLYQFKPGFGEHAGACWFSNRRALALFFGAPVALVVLVNMVFFLHSSSMVLSSSTSSGRRHYSTSSGSSAIAPLKVRPNMAHFGDCEDCRAAEYAQQNSMTTSSLASVQTIQSQLSGSSVSESPESDSIEEGSPTGTTKMAQPLALIVQLPAATSNKRKLTPSASFSSLKHHSMALEARLADNLSSLVGSIAKDYRLYCRLSTITGTTWLVGLLASLVDHSDSLWYLFVILNTLQGLFIFIAFGCKRSKLANLELLIQYIRLRCSAR